MGKDINSRNPEEEEVEKKEESEVIEDTKGKKGHINTAVTIYLHTPEPGFMYKTA